jgi:hypothetical protein
VSSQITSSLSRGANSHPKGLNPVKAMQGEDTAFRYKGGALGTDPHLRDQGVDGVGELPGEAIGRGQSRA